MKIAAVLVLAAITLVSVPDEIAIGRRANADVRKQVGELSDPAVRRYVAALGRRLAAVAPGPKYPYTFSVADAQDLNAFSLPGGPVWINRGLLAAATNESQVAGVLAHEIAHVAERHAAGQLTRAIIARWGLGFVGAMLGNTGGAAAAERAAGVLTGGAFLKFSRDDEREADRVGVQIVARAGWDAHGMVELLDILRRNAKQDPDAVQVFLSTHPSPRERIPALEALADTRRGGRRDSAAFRSIRARLGHASTRARH
jgi:predicted Zn-dependent protease